MKTKVRLSLHLKLWLNGKIVLSTNKRIKDRILAAAQGRMWDKAQLRVTYDYIKGHYNDGTYPNYECLKWAISAFTEKELLDYIQRT